MNLKSNSLENVILDRLIRSKRISISKPIKNVKINIQVKKRYKLMYTLFVDFGDFDYNSQIDDEPSLEVVKKVTGLSQIEILKKILEAIPFLKNTYKEFVFDLSYIFE